MTKRWLIGSRGVAHDDCGLVRGHVVAGMNASTPCQACHGADGIGISEEIPNLAGQKVAYLQAQLRAFKSGDRKHDVMGPLAKQLSEADVDNLAAYWNSLPVGGPPKEAAATAVAARRPQMTFPTDFPASFVNYYTQEDAATKSVTRFYANAVALQAARAGKPLPNGSIIMVEGTTARRDDLLLRHGAARGMGPRRSRAAAQWRLGLCALQCAESARRKEQLRHVPRLPQERRKRQFVFTLGKLKE